MKTLDELRALPTATAEVLPVSHPEHFLPPQANCYACDRTLGGWIGSFSLGLAWGAGQCTCGYPARVYHDIGDGKVLRSLAQYHPNALVETEDE